MEVYHAMVEKSKRIVDEILANLDSLSITPTLTAESYELIAKAGFRDGNGTLAAIICQELVESNPVTQQHIDRAEWMRLQAVESMEKETFEAALACLEVPS